MKPLEELTAMLCECESVREDVMEPIFGCKVWKDTILWFNELEDDEWYFKEYILVDDLFNILYWYEWEMIITWNPIQDHHLRMYCEENKINISINEVWELLEGWNIWNIHLEYQRLDIFLDNKKPLHQQSNETLTKIINFLKDKLWTHSKVKQ